MTAAVIIAGVFFGFGSLVGWFARAIMAGPDVAELYRLRGDVARITAHTMARRQARAAASRKGWATKRGKAKSHKMLCRDCASERCAIEQWVTAEHDGVKKCEDCGVIGVCALVQTKGGEE